MELERIRLTPADELYLTEDTAQIVSARRRTRAEVSPDHCSVRQVEPCLFLRDRPARGQRSRAFPGCMTAVADALTRAPTPSTPPPSSLSDPAVAHALPMRCLTDVLLEDDCVKRVRYRSAGSRRHSSSSR